MTVLRNIGRLPVEKIPNYLRLPVIIGRENPKYVLGTGMHVGLVRFGFEIRMGWVVNVRYWVASKRRRLRYACVVLYGERVRARMG